MRSQQYLIIIMNSSSIVYDSRNSLNKHKKTKRIGHSINSDLTPGTLIGGGFSNIIADRRIISAKKTLIIIPKKM